MRLSLGGDTNFNVKVPIVSIKGVAPAVVDTAKDVKEKANELHELMEAYNQGDG